jgi:hypothetical protein
MQASHEVVPVFVGATARRRATWGWALFKLELLLLERQQRIDPLDDE